MHLSRIFIATAAALTFGAGGAVAQDFGNELKARQGQFRIMALNLGVLGGMAQGKMEYDAAKAEAAAANLVLISQLDQGAFWPAGSDTMSIEGTRAQPTIWEDFDDVVAKWGDFGTQAVALQQVAGGGVEGLGAAVGAIGGTCKACHEAHRAPE